MISSQEFQNRRLKLRQELPSDALAIISAASWCTRNADSHFPFRQSSDFLYLTGFEESDAILVLSRDYELLFNQTRDLTKEVWTGPILGQEEAMRRLHVDKALPIEQFEAVFSSMLKQTSCLYYPFSDTAFASRLFLIWQTQRSRQRGGLAKDAGIHDLGPILAKLRLLKSADEIACIQKAIDASVLAHRDLMQHIHRFSYEYEAAACFHHRIQAEGMMATAYPSILASGPNACTLHYTGYSRKFEEHDLLLIDAGAEYLGYAADISRTYPVRRKWQGAQRAIYQLVLQAQQEAIAAIQVGAAWTVMQEIIVKVLSQGLIDLGILNGHLEDVLEQKAYLPYYMHSSGHYLGLDVHDVGVYDNACLQAGMVLTVEPGLYFPVYAEQIPAEFRGIGVRIEDDVYLSSDKAVIMSDALPKTIEDLQACGDV